MTFRELVKTAAGVGRVKEEVARGIIFALAETIKTSLEKGEDVVIPGFGKFKVKYSKPRRLYNVIKQEFYTSTPKEKITFNFSKGCPFTNKTEKGEN